MDSFRKVKNNFVKLVCPWKHCLPEFTPNSSSSVFQPPKEYSPWKYIVRGSYYQGDMVSKFVDNQCTSMALTAAMYNHMKCVNKWKREDIDLILTQGDSNHHRFREVFRFSDNKDKRIALSDLPEIFTMHVKETKAVGLKLGDWAGPVSSKMSGYNGEFRKFCPTLMDVLRENLKTNRPVIATIAVFTLAFIKVGSKIWLFDSHERDRRGNEAILNGKAFVVPFNNLQQIEEYLVKIYGKDSFFNAFSLKIWIPEEYVESDEAIVKNIEHQLYVSASYKQCNGKMAEKTT